MSPEKEDKDRLSDLLRFIDLMVRQTCRRAHYDHLTRTRPSREDKDSIFSTDYLKKIYDKPREYIYLLLKNPQKTLKGLKVDYVGALAKKEWKLSKIEQKMLLDFVRKVQEHAPKPHFVWIDLQHYLFYVYRHFACQVPKATSETLSAFFVCEMRELINYLRNQDESQVWMRVFTLLREYCIFAQWHYSQNDKDEPLKKFFSYYEAMLTAAKSLIPVFLEFERDIIFKNYRLCWIDFNTFLFIRFFYESDRVKTKVDDCLKTKKSPGDTAQTYASMLQLKKVWLDIEKRSTIVNMHRKLPDHSQDGIRDKRALAAHKKLLTATFWVERSKEVKKIIDIDRLDDNIFDLLKDKDFFPEGPGLNKNGQCICEECLVAKYKSYLDSNEDFDIIATEDRTTYCRKCRGILNLDQFQRHVNSHIKDLNLNHTIRPPLTRIIPDKVDLVKLKDSTAQLSEKFMEKLKITDNYLEITKVNKSEVISNKVTYEKLLPNRKELKLGDKVKNGRTPSLREELIASGFGPINNDFDKPVIPKITTDKLAETELMLREMRKYGHAPQHIEGCDEFFRPLESPETLERSKKCNCSYCEIFGAPVFVEPRDKIRVRLQRRKERRMEIETEHQKPAEPEYNSRFKTESRVPLPPSPSHFPHFPRPPGSSTTSSDSLSDPAQKKAAKKARQREKREQEKLEAELEVQRKLEEVVRQKEELEKQLQQEKDEQEQLRKLEEAKLKKKLKKQRQAQKRQDIALLKNTIEETIPAVVTIKRVPGGENGTPSVTITLKGCTPDQDKLLTRLVEEPQIEVQKPKPVLETNKAPSLDPKGGKKKKPSKPGVQAAPMPQPEVPKLPEPTIIAKDVKVTLALDKTPITSISSPVTVISRPVETKPRVREVKREREPTEEEIKALGNLRLPPGITITKVEGPVNVNKPYIGSESNKASSVLGKSGVIVVDTEKLIKKSESDNTTVVKGKKKKKKSKKIDSHSNNGPKDKPKMVTLRNPMFQPFQPQNLSKTPMTTEETAPAAIFTSENGMVTIRSSRLQQSIDKGLVGNSPMGMGLMPDLLSQVPNFANPNSYNPEKSPNKGEKLGKEETKNKHVSTMDAQEILSGLPGIEITKIDKKCEHSHGMGVDGNSCNDAQVSIIPSNGSEFNLDFDKDEDWIYDNVFKPRDVLEDDMDDEELELEAFKRFCHQSVPPKEKAVAHFNVAEIVLKKKLT